MLGPDAMIPGAAQAERAGIQTLAARNHAVDAENKTFFVSNKTFFVSNKTFFVSNKTFFVSNKTFFVSNKTFFVSNKTFFVSNKTFFVSNKTFFVSNKTFFVSNKTFFVSNKTFFVSKKTLFALKKTLFPATTTVVGRDDSRPSFCGEGRSAGVGVFARTRKRVCGRERSALWQARPQEAGGPHCPQKSKILGARHAAFARAVTLKPKHGRPFPCKSRQKNTANTPNT